MSWGAMAAGKNLGWGTAVLEEEEEEEEGWRKGPWTGEEDRLLIEYVKLHGEGRWKSVARLAGLKRNGKSCRLRWVNYLRPDLKRGQITPHEETIILELHARWGNRWSTIARSLPGRTDNEIKNYWRTHFKKKSKASSDNKEKAKARLLKRQQFQQEQQQLQLQLLQQQQQQQQQQFNTFDMKNMMSLLDENEVRVPSLPQLVRQDMAALYPITAEEQGFFFPLLHGYAPVVPMPEAYNENEESHILWDGLWNLDDIHGNLSMACAAANKMAGLQTLATPFC